VNKIHYDLFISEEKVSILRNNLKVSDLLILIEYKILKNIKIKFFALKYFSNFTFSLKKKQN